MKKEWKLINKNLKKMLITKNKESQFYYACQICEELEKYINKETLSIEMKEQSFIYFVLNVLRRNGRTCLYHPLEIIFIRRFFKKIMSKQLKNINILEIEESFRELEFSLVEENFILEEDKS